jgi:hypothetical protein
MMGWIASIIKNSTTYYDLHSRYVDLTRTKEFYEQKCADLERELEDPRKEAKDLQKHVEHLTTIIKNKDELIRQQTEADILWAARQINRRKEEPVVPKIIFDPRLTSYVHPTSLTNSIYQINP